MDPADVLILSLIVIGLNVPIFLGVALARARRRVRELEVQLRVTNPEPDARIEHLERNVEALMDQMEQLANGQEFLNRLMTRQPGQVPRASSPPPVITPH